MPSVEARGSEAGRKHMPRATACARVPHQRLTRQVGGAKRRCTGITSRRRTNRDRDLLAGRGVAALALLLRRVDTHGQLHQPTSPPIRTFTTLALTASRLAPSTAKGRPVDSPLERIFLTTFRIRRSSQSAAPPASVVSTASNLGEQLTALTASNAALARIRPGRTQRSYGRRVIASSRTLVRVTMRSRLTAQHLAAELPSHGIGVPARDPQAITSRPGPWSAMETRISLATCPLTPDRVTPVPRAGGARSARG